MKVTFPDFSAGRSRRPGPTFVCTLRAGEVGPTWVHIVGDLDISTAPRLEHALRHADTSPLMVILDLRGLTFLDSAGVHVIVDASTRARREDRWLIVIRGSAQVDRMLRLSGAAEVLYLVDLDTPAPENPAAPGHSGAPDLAWDAESPSPG